MYKIQKNWTFYVFVFSVILITISFTDCTAQSQFTDNPQTNLASVKNQNDNIDCVGGVIDVSDLKIGFLNNGRFCAPEGYLPDLPSALYEKYGYLGRLDLWVGIPGGPWAPKVWNPDSQKYISLGPTVSGTVYEPRPTGTDWSTINLTREVLYSSELFYNDVYKPSELFDFMLAPINENKQTWPRNPLTGLREWPGRWKIDPLSGKPIEGMFFGDQQIFVSFDDKIYANQYYEVNTNGQVPPQRGYSIGAEVLAQVIGFREAYISNIVIFDLQIINTSVWDYSDIYLGIYYESRNPWYSTTVDPGFYGLKTNYIKNEYCPEIDETLPYNLSYNFNRDDEVHEDDDTHYFGVQLLKTPLAMDDHIDNDGDGTVDEDGEELGLTGWHFFPHNGVSFLIQEREILQYQLLKGDTTGIGSYTFFQDNYDGYLDPNFDAAENLWYIGTYWGLFYPRGVLHEVFNLLSCGPINWQSGDTLNFVFGILVAENMDKLKGSAQLARKIVQMDYQRSDSPPPPHVTAVPQDERVVLYWDRSAETARDFITGYQDFEGYKIYRSTSPPEENQWGTPIYDHYGQLINFIPIARCDLENDIVGYEIVYPFQDLGKDTGLFHTWTDSTVTNGVTYWYSVCSYDHGISDNIEFNPNHFPVSPMKECAKGIDPEKNPNLVEVIPGVKSANYSLPKLEVSRLPKSAGNGLIEPFIINPYQITGHDYLISFEDTTYGYAIYNLIDETEKSIIAENVKSTNGEEGIIFDGIQLTIQRYDDMTLLGDKTYWFQYESGEPSECTWSVSGEKLILDSFPTEYDIIFTNKMDTSVFTKKTAPFEIWNTILEKKAKWDIYYNHAGTDTTDSLVQTWSSGDLIYVWDSLNENSKFTFSIVITERSLARNDTMVNIPPQPGDALHFAFKMPFITGDQFRISSTTMQEEKVTHREVTKIKVVPNPYVEQANWELGKDDSRIQFIHLPSECTIHIYTLAGDKVRTLHHTNPNTDYEFWDLLNFSNLKASYGLYVYVVETPDGRATTGKFVILR